MKTVFQFSSLLAAIFLLAGCGNNNNSPKTAAPTNTSTAAGNNPLNAPADYLGGLANSQNKAVKVIDDASLNQAIQMFNVQEGRFPTNLNELTQKDIIPHVPDPPRGMKFDYNANTGVLKVVPAE